MSEYTLENTEQRQLLVKIITMQGSNESAFKNACDFCFYHGHAFVFGKTHFCKSVPFAKFLMWVELPSGCVAPGS